MERAPPSVFEVLDTLDGAVRLERPSATLDGSIPLRAAQACSPLLDGNRAGFQLLLREQLWLTKSLGRPGLSNPPERLLRLLRGSVPRFVAEGLLPKHSLWPKRMERGLVWREGRGPRVGFFTGLFVRPRPGFCLRIGHAGNRRNVLFDVEERWLTDTENFVPLVLSLTPSEANPFPLLVHGELATLMPFVSCARPRVVALDQALDVGRGHLDFFDAKYFEQKKKGSTQKYKRMRAQTSEPKPGEKGELRCVSAGPECLVQSTSVDLLTATGVERGNPPVARLIFQNAVAFTAKFDGHNTRVEPNASALEGFADRTRAAWASAFDAETLERHRGAIWYFTKYVTPHQAGEPLFFVKPPALVSTAPGWSTLVEGFTGSGFEVLRGVVATDQFHALPAVFRLSTPGRRVRVRAGAPLAQFMPFPRWLLDATHERVEWGYAPRSS
ncbi:MAG: hypothetical protein IPI67_28470 [Myxococcales bacterium]|nr:hypothetical protein [Myxococcales bacterium]